MRLEVRLALPSRQSSGLWNVVRMNQDKLIKSYTLPGDFSPAPRTSFFHTFAFDLEILSSWFRTDKT